MSTTGDERIERPGSPRQADPWLWILLPTTRGVRADLCCAARGPHCSQLSSHVRALRKSAPRSRWRITGPSSPIRFTSKCCCARAASGCLVTLGCLVVGYPVAYYLARTPSRWRGFALFLVISPLLVSAIVRNIGWFPLLSQSGAVNWLLLKLGLIATPLSLINNFTGVVIGLVHALLPFMILTLTTVIQRIDVDLEEAAANLGAGPLQTFWRVLLPLSLPGVVSGSLLVFAMAISAYTTPAILGGNRVLVMATYIAQQFRTVLNYPAGGTAAALLLLFAIVLTVLALQVRTAGERAP